MFWGTNHHSQFEEHKLLFGNECVNCRHYCPQDLHIFWVRVKLFNKFPKNCGHYCSYFHEIVHIFWANLNVQPNFQELFTVSDQESTSSNIPDIVCVIKFP